MVAASLRWVSSEWFRGPFSSKQIRLAHFKNDDIHLAFIVEKIVIKNSPKNVGAGEPTELHGGGSMKRLALFAIPAALLLFAGTASAYDPIKGWGFCNIPQIGDPNTSVDGTYMFDLEGIVNEYFEWTNVALPNGDPDWSQLTGGMFGADDDIKGLSWANVRFGTESSFLWARWVNDRSVVTRVDSATICASVSPSPIEPPAEPTATASTAATIWLGEAFSWVDRAGRRGSTSPMPMNEITQANATAQTAFGCVNGLAAVWVAVSVAWGPLMRVVLSRRER